LQERYGKLSSILAGLQETGYTDGRATVTQLRDFWYSLPQLNDRSGLDAVIRSCDRILNPP
jgi:hypothetical protein